MLVRGDEASTNNSLHVVVDHGRLSWTESRGDATQTITAEPGELLTLSGSKDQLNDALGRAWYAPPPDWNSLGLAGFEVLTVLLEGSASPAEAGNGLDAGPALLVRVTPVNDPPFLRSPDRIVALEDVPTIIEGIVVGDRDVQEGDGVMEVIVSAGARGSTVKLGTELGLWITESSAQRIAFRGSPERANAALAGLTYQGPPGFSGTDRLGIAVDDRGNTGEGGALGASGTVSIDVRPVNDRPRVTREGTGLVRGFEDEPIPLPGIALDDPDAGDADVKLTVEARFGTVAVTRAPAGVELENGGGEPYSWLVMIGSLEVRANRDAILSLSRYSLGCYGAFTCAFLSPPSILAFSEAPLAPDRVRTASAFQYTRSV